MQCSVFIATSVDGFIAKADGDIDWLSLAHLEGEDYGYQAFADSTGVLVMGRNSFDKVMSFPQWPYGDKPVVVVSRGLRELPADAPPSVELSREQPQALAAGLQQRGFQHAYLDGGQLIQSFLAAGLIDDMVLTTLPITLGSGIPLFAAATLPVLASHEQRWQLLSHQIYSNGVLQRHYQKA